MRSCSGWKHMPTLPMGCGSVTDVGKLPSQSNLPNNPFHWLWRAAVFGRHHGMRSTDDPVDNLICSISERSEAKRAFASNSHKFKEHTKTELTFSWQYVLWCQAECASRHQGVWVSACSARDWVHSFLSKYDRTIQSPRHESISETRTPEDRYTAKQKPSFEWCSVLLIFHQ